MSELLLAPMKERSVQAGTNSGSLVPSRTSSCASSRSESDFEPMSAKAGVASPIIWNHIFGDLGRISQSFSSKVLFVGTTMRYIKPIKT